MISRLAYIEKKRKLTKWFILFFAVVIVFIVWTISLRLLGFYNKISTGGKDDTPQKEKTEYNFLLLGYGGGVHDGAYLTDTIIAVHIDLKSKKILLISIPRDVWVKVPTKNDVFHSKINAVYQMGLFPKDYPDIDTKYLSQGNPSGLIKEVAEKVTGLKIDGYLAVDFQGFVKTIDTLGGIEVNIEQSFVDNEYPIQGEENNLCGKTETDLPELEKLATESAVLAFPCRYETVTFTAGKTLMDGETALKYSRSRHSNVDGGDFNRAKRQQKVIEAIKSKVLSIGFIPKIIPLLNELENHITTDIALSNTNKLFIESRNAKEYIVSTFVISDDYLMPDISDDGQYIIIPNEGQDNWSVIRRKIQNIILGITPTPSKPVKLISPTNSN